MPKFWAHGTEVEFGGQEITHLTSISLPDESREVVQTTDNKSGGDAEKLPGLRDGGQVTLEGRLDPEDDGYQALRTNYQSDADVEETVITLPAPAGTEDRPTYTFQAFVVSMGGDLPQEGNEPGSFTATLEVSGAVTLDDGTSA